MRTLSTVYDAELIDDLQGDTSGYFGRMLFSLASAARQETPGDEGLAVEEAQKLIDVSIMLNCCQICSQFRFVSARKKRTQKKSD